MQRVQPQHTDAEALGHGDSRASLIPGDEDRLRADIGEVEFELVGAVGRIEGRGRGSASDRDESRRHFRPVRQHDGDPIATADSACVQLAGRFGDLTAKGAMGKRCPFGSGNRRRVFRAGGNPLNDRCRLRQH